MPRENDDLVKEVVQKRLKKTKVQPIAPPPIETPTINVAQPDVRVVNQVNPTPVTVTTNLGPVLEVLDKHQKALESVVRGMRAAITANQDTTAAALASITTAMVAAIKEALGNIKITVSPQIVVQAPETKGLDVPAVVQPATPPKKRRLTIHHSDGSESTVTES